MTKRFPHYISVLSASAVCVCLLLCSKYENRNPVSSDYQGDYRLRVAWKSLPSPMEMNRDYAVSCTTGSDAFVSIMPLDSQRQYLDTVMLSSDIKSGTLTFRFLKEFRDTLVLVGLRPNKKVVWDGSFLVVENMLKPHLSFADPSFAVGHGTNSIIVNVQDSSGIVRKLYWRFKQETDADSLPNAANGPAKINVFVPDDLYYDTLMIWGVNDRGYVSDTLKTALTVKGFSPGIDSIVWPSSLRCGDTLTCTAFLADTPASKFRVLASGAHSHYSDTSMLYAYHKKVEVRMTKPLVDTGLVRLQVQLADSAGIRSRLIIDSLFVQYTLPFLRFADARDTMLVTRNDTAEIQVSDTTATAATYTWHIEGRGVIQATPSDRLKLFVGDSLMTIRVFGTNVYGYCGDTAIKVLLPQPFTYRLGPAPDAFPDTIVARHEASWTVVLDSAAKLSQFGGQYYWQVITGKDTARQSGPTLTSVTRTIADSASLQIKVAAQDQFGGSSNELSRFVTVRTFRPYFRFLKHSDTTRIGTSMTIHARVFDSNPLGGKIDSVFWDKNADGSIDIATIDSSVTVVYPYAGAYSIAGWARDNDGFLSDPDTTRILVKADYPYFLSRADTSTYTDVPCTLHVAASPGESGVPINRYYWYIAEDNKRDSTAVPAYTYMFTRALTYTVIASCKDTGNVASATSDTFRVTADPGVPVISSVTIDTAETAVFVNDLRIFRIGASDPNGLVRKICVNWNGDTVAQDSVTVSGQNVLDSISHLFPGAGAGLKSVKVWAVDNSGLRSVIFTKQITVRLGRPIVLGMTKDSSTVYVNDHVKYSLNTADTNGTVQSWFISWNTGAQFKQYSPAPVDTVFGTAGTRSVKAYVLDNDGVSSDTFSYDLSVVAAAPAITSISLADTTENALFVADRHVYRVIATTPHGLITKVFVNWNNGITPDDSMTKSGSTVIDTFAHTFSVNASGQDTIRAWAINSMGQVSPMLSKPIVVRLGRPKMLSIAKDSAIVYAHDAVNYTISAMDTNGTIKDWYLAWDAIDGFRQVIGGKVTTTFISAGTRNVRAYAIDDDDLISDTLTWQLVVHGGAPVVDSLNPKAVWVNDDTTFSIFNCDTNGTVDSLFIDWGDATPVVKYKTGDVIRHKYAASKAGVDTVKVIAKDNDGVLSDVFKCPVVVHSGIPAVDSIKIDAPGNTIFINDLRTYGVYAHDTNGSIKTMYAAWDGGVSPEESVQVAVPGTGYGSFSHSFTANLSGNRAPRFWVRDDDTIMSSRKDTAILVRLAPPVLWGDNPTKDTVWTIINNGYGVTYNIHINSRDTNGTINRYYWSEAGAFDSSTATKTSDSLYPRLIGINDVNHAFPAWIYGRDDDGLITGRQFVVFADSAPPKPSILNPPVGGLPSLTLRWINEDTKDLDNTQFQIMIGYGVGVQPTTILQAYQAGKNYIRSGSEYRFTFTPTTNIFSVKVLSKDARGSVSESDVQNYSY